MLRTGSFPKPLMILCEARMVPSCFTPKGLDDLNPLKKITQQDKMGPYQLQMGLYPLELAL